MKPVIRLGFLALCATGLLAGCDGSGSASQGFPGLGGSPRQVDEGDFAILLQSFSGPDHMKTAEYYRASTEAQAGWQGLYVVIHEDRSELYWHKYPTVEAAANDLKTAKEWKTKAGAQPYLMALVVPLPGKDVGPEEWNLKNAHGAYTVVVAAFYDVPEKNFFGRKQIAVDACKLFRDKREEAYFFHGVSQSLVCIGVFPESSIKEVWKNGVWERQMDDPNMARVRLRHPYLADNGFEKIVTAPDIYTKKAIRQVVESYIMPLPGFKPPERAIPQRIAPTTTPSSAPAGVVGSPTGNVP